MKFKTDEIVASDALLLGRVTYEGFAQAWPKMTDTGAFGTRIVILTYHTSGNEAAR